MAARATVCTCAVTTDTSARHILVNNDGFTKQTAAGGATSVMGATRRTTFRLDRILDNSPIKVNHINLVNHMAIDAPNVWE
jgi:hypothetical protein